MRNDPLLSSRLSTVLIFLYPAAVPHLPATDQSIHYLSLAQLHCEPSTVTIFEPPLQQPYNPTTAVMFALRKRARDEEEAEYGELARAAKVSL